MGQAGYFTYDGRQVEPSAPVIDYGTLARRPLVFAGFWTRFLAAFIDGLIVVAMGVGLVMAFRWYVGEETAQANALMFTRFIQGAIVVVAWIYGATLESGPSQSTLGKRLLGLKVTDLSGNRISFLRASVRHFGKILSHFFMIGYLIMKLRLLINPPVGPPRVKTKAIRAQTRHFR